jgi:hypothetical protein
MEEGSALRRPTSETTNSLSVCDRVRSIPWDLLRWWSWGSRDTRVRERVSTGKLGCVPRYPVSHATLGPLGQPEKAMGHESPIEPWLTPHNHVLLCWFQNRLASLRTSDENRRSCSITWAAKQEKSQPLAECFFFTPTIELTRTRDARKAILQLTGARPRYISICTGNHQQTLLNLTVPD